MKKYLSASLVAALLVTGATSAFAHQNKGEVKTSVEIKADKLSKAEKQSNVDSVLQDVALKKELIELRQELKKLTKITQEQQEKIKRLVAELEKRNDKKQALEVQLELLEKTYRKGDHSAFVKVGELLEATGTGEIFAFVDGKLVKPDVAPFIHKGRTLVPVRAISESLKADVKWEPETRTVVITRGENTIVLYLDKTVATVNGKTVILDTVPVLKKGRVFLPIRFVSERLNANVTWQPKGKIVIIEDQQLTETTDDTENETEEDTQTDTETGDETDTEE